MTIKSVGQNSVVVANQFNQSIFTLPWMVKHDLFALDDVNQQGTIIAPQLVQVVTGGFQLLVLPNRIQLAPTCDESIQSEVIQKVMGKIVRVLPQTPYTAVGLNINYEVRFPDGTHSARNRSLIARNTVFSPFFSDDSARFGAYFSQDYLGCRLKLDVKPVIHIEENYEAMSFEFNFHKDIKNQDTAAEDVIEMFGRWNEAREIAKQIAGAADNA